MARRVVIAIVAIVVGGFCVMAAVLATIYWSNSKVSSGLRDQQSQGIWHSVSWRTRLYIKKLEGDVPELPWSELWQMTRQPGGFGLEELIEEGQGMDAAILNPFTSGDDLEAGKRIYRERCAACHGPDGKGYQAPPLNRIGYKNGDRDLNINEVLKNGIPATTMVSPGLSFRERWQLIGYLRNLQFYSAGGDVADGPQLDIQVSSQQIQSPDVAADEWLTYSGSISGRRYNSLTKITRSNVSQLRLQWVHQSNSKAQEKFESTPLVTGKVMFTTEPTATVVALNATTGDVIWKYEHILTAKPVGCCGTPNRGLAILGSSLFFGSIDGHLIAINANNGKKIWETQVASPSEGYSLTGAPLVVNNSVIVGVSGGDLGVRGFLVAFDTANGQLQWKFNTVPGPGEFGHETWENDAWRTGGGPTWVTGSYDPSLDLIYWGVGNPAPDYSGDVRPGDSLFTESVIALHASSGKLAWHFQFTPHDEHDWDSVQTPILADVLLNGVNRKVICLANKNGFYYVLDRVTGEFLVGTPFVEQNWADGLDSTGRPILSETGRITAAGSITKPGIAGGVNWQPSAFDPNQVLVFVSATEGSSIFTKSPAKQIARQGDGQFLGSTGIMRERPINFVRALDAGTGARRWEYLAPPATKGWNYSGLLATAGGLVFGASGPVLFALDSATGSELWRVVLGGDVVAAPISFALDGRQMIAVTAGRALFVFGL